MPLMTNPDGAMLLQLFTKNLADQANPVAAFSGVHTAWTKIATNALVDTARDVTGDSCTRAAKGHTTPAGRSEHLAIDVVAYGKDYGPIQFAAEHENSHKLEQVTYCAWKLLQLRSRIRVLVAYWSSDSNRPAPHSANELAGAIATGKLAPHQDYSGEEIILLTADRNATPVDSDALRKLFELRTVTIGRH
jgi:hypothetical protein